MADIIKVRHHHKDNDGVERIVHYESEVGLVDGLQDSINTAVVAANNYTDQQIATIPPVDISGKQDKISGEAGQTVVFDESGNLIATDAIDASIAEAVVDQNSGNSLRFWSGTKEELNNILERDNNTVYITTNDESSDIDGSSISYDNSTSSLSANNVQDAIDEVLLDGKNYTDQQIASIPTPDVSGQIGTHNVATDAHNDLRLLITELTTRLNALANSDDTTLDQMAEVVAYIKDNRELIEQVTTGKVSVSDIVDNLTTNVANKPLSAAQGVALKSALDECFTSVSEGKSLVAAAVTDMGVETAADDTFVDMASNVKAISKDATAVARDILEDKTAWSSGKIITGTMTDNGAISQVLNCGDSIVIPEGYHNGNGSVTANSLASQTSATATSEDIVSGKTAWVDGAKVTGTAVSSAPKGTPMSFFKDITSETSGVNVVFTDEGFTVNKLLAFEMVFGVGYTEMAATTTSVYYLSHVSAFLNDTGEDYVVAYTFSRKFTNGLGVSASSGYDSRNSLIDVTNTGFSIKASTQYRIPTGTCSCHIVYI